MGELDVVSLLSHLRPAVLNQSADDISTIHVYVDTHFSSFQDCGLAPRQPYSSSKSRSRARFAASRCSSWTPQSRHSIAYSGSTRVDNGLRQCAETLQRGVGAHVSDLPTTPCRFIPASLRRSRRYFVNNAVAVRSTGTRGPVKHVAARSKRKARAGIAAIGISLEVVEDCFSPGTETSSWRSYLIGDATADTI